MLDKCLVENNVEIDKKHALLSPSSSYKWLNCTPSARLEENLEEDPSISAAIGSAAHAVCQYKLNRELGRGWKMVFSPYYDDEMDFYTSEYVDYVLRQVEKYKKNCKDVLVLVEEKLDFSYYVKDGFGTGDCVIVGDDALHIIDFKYGKGIVVNSQNNYQMMIYALGAFKTYESLYDIKQVHMTIFQPRRNNVSTFSINVEKLKKWGEDILKPTASLAYEGEGQYKSGEWCTFCKGSVKCRARAIDSLNLTKYNCNLPPLLDDEEIEEILPRLVFLEKWASDIMDYANKESVNNGKTWRGFHLVESKTNRRFRNEDIVANLAITNGYEDIYKKSLISIREMEKLMGKEKFSKIMGDFVYKPKGKLRLVPDKKENTPLI